MTPALSKLFASAPPIAVVGNINLDIRTSPIRASDSILSDGETSVAEIYESLGGGGANTAAAACALGGKVHFCGAVGDDELGRRLGHHLRELGIVAQLAIKPSPTGRSLALTWDNHHRHFLSCLPSSAELDGTDIDLSALHASGCRHLYRADVWFAPKMLAGGNLKLLSEARSLGMETSIDINWDPAWTHPNPAFINPRLQALAEVLPHVTWVHGNERELCRFSDQNEMDAAARWILKRGAGRVIVHRGSSGCAAFTSDGNFIQVPARSVQRVVNETATGDVFTAAFLLLPNLPIRDRLVVAADVAASHLEGAVELLPRF